jgi:hypothetical protein
VILSDLEEDIAPSSKEEDDKSNHAGGTAFLQPHVVACVGEEGGKGCSSPKSPVSDDLHSDASTPADSGSQFHPTESECDTESATEEEVGSETSEEEAGLETSKDQGLPPSYSPKVLRKSVRTLGKDLQSNITKVCDFL